MSAVKHNLDVGSKAFGMLDERLEKAMNDAAERTGDMFIRDSIQVMRDNGSVETSTGIRSFRNRELGKGKRGIYAASYLEALDRGTTPHSPDTNNPRFQIWARSHGFTRDQLARVIAEKGTQPHQWIREATKRTRKRKPKMVKIEVDEALKRTEKMLK